jgi:hypothetical protein
MDDVMDLDPIVGKMIGRGRFTPADERTDGRRAGRESSAAFAA